MLHTHAEYNLAFAPKGKPLLVCKGFRSLNLNHPLLILVITLSNALPLALVMSHQDNKTFPQFQETSYSSLCLDSSLLCLFADLHMSDISTCYPLSVYLK